MPAGGANRVRPKAYIGLFKDNAVAVLDTGTNQVIKTIPVPTGPHGMVITSDGRWVYVSSDGDLEGEHHRHQHRHGRQFDRGGGQVTARIGDYAGREAGAGGGVWHKPGGLHRYGQPPGGRAIFVPTPHNIAISPDGQTAYVAAQKQGSTGLAELNIATKSQASFVSRSIRSRAR